MLSFDTPWAALALLLFLPFQFWLRHREPRAHVVGGLEPFRSAKSEGHASRRRRPLSYWLLLFGFLGTVFAMMGPRGGGLAPLLLVDRSLSAQRYAEAAERPIGHEMRELGSATEVITHREILAALRDLQPGRPVTVWTDLAPPEGLPDSIRWKGAGTENPPAQIVLQRLPIAPDRWLEHQAFADGRDALRTVEGKAADFGLPALQLLTDSTVHPAWDAAFQAIWPDLRIERSVEPRDAPPLLAWPLLLADGVTVPSPGLWSSLPWHRAPTPDEVVQLLRSWPIEPPLPLDRREVLSQTPPTRLPHFLHRDAQTSQGQPPRWRTLLVLCSGLLATAGWFWLPGKRAYSSPSAV